MALALAGLPALLLGLERLRSGWSSPPCVYLVALPGWSFSSKDGAPPSTASSPRSMWSAFVVAVAPLVWLLWVVLKNGIPAINAAFLTHSMLNVVGDEQGGIYHALHRHAC